MADEPAKIAPHPIYLYEKGVELPKEGMYYVVAKNGIFMRKKTMLTEGLVQVDSIASLQEIDPEIKLNLPKVPISILAQAHDFFLQVWDEHSSESYVTLFYSRKKNEYSLYCPKQIVTRGSVNYERDDQPDFAQRKELGLIPVGTIHSHCNFDAFHSGTDTSDEATFDGLHITIGHVDAKAVSLASSIAINASRIQLDPQECCEGLLKNDQSFIKKTFGWGQDNNNRFTFILTDKEKAELKLASKVIKETWMPKVTKGAVFGGKYKGNYFNFNDDDDVSDYFGNNYSQSSDEFPADDIWSRYKNKKNKKDKDEPEGFID